MMDIYEYRMKNGVKDGYYRGWGYDEDLVLECYYKDGKLEGEHKRWNSRGQLTKLHYYKDDNGEFYLFYDGKLLISIMRGN